MAWPKYLIPAQGLRLVEFLFFFSFAAAAGSPEIAAADPTNGFTAKPLNASSFINSYPYDMPLCARYIFLATVHRFSLVYTDKPPSEYTPLKPRSLINIQEYVYLSGVWQFEGYLYVPDGRTGMSVMNIMGLFTRSAKLGLTLKGNGSLCLLHDGSILASDIYDKWVRVNVIHNVGARTAQILIGGNVAKTAKKCGSRWPELYFFQFGVTLEADGSIYMEARWMNISVLKKDE